MSIKERDKENIQANKVNAPILFIGLGGVGSDIVKGVAERAINDDTSNIRFVVMDTDVNDLLSAEKGSEIIPIQTSSTRIVESYLNNDKDAKQNWFPDNKMLDPKTVSEGAGQVRAISRLALNDIIKSGKINKLYKAIDDLFLKDGSGFKQAIRVMIVSTTAGGTGSGIAMEIGMLVRHYVKKNYPESAVKIRSFLVLPGVLDTVIKSQSEKDSLRCNTYATLKEINAFMMKGSGFFDTVPELQRYKALHISIPSSSTGKECISNLPFDFCFLMDRTDTNGGNMSTLKQYKDYAAQSIYEQNIGSMRKKASSQEDNVLKLFLDPDKLGRCRFGGVGASVLKYPYEQIRDYIALNWARYRIMGSSSDPHLSETEQKALLESSWLQYDEKFKQEHKMWEENLSSSSKNEPKLSEIYMSSMEAGRESKSGNDFSMRLWDKFLNAKVRTLSDEEEEKTIDTVARKYVDDLVKGVTDGQIENEYSFHANKTFEIAKKTADNGGYANRFNAIYRIEDSVKSSRFINIVRAFIKEVFSSKASSEKEDLGEYMLEKFLSAQGQIMHPNAARYMLYKLQKAIEAKGTEATEFLASFENKKIKITETADDDKKTNNPFEVPLHMGRENNLLAMCEACDKLKKIAEIAGNPSERCNDFLKKYYELVRKYFNWVITKEICDIAKKKIDDLVGVYEEFYASFERKVPDIEKKKEVIIANLAFHNGDCVRYVLGKKEYLNRLVENAGRASDSGEKASKLYAKIFESLRNNAYIEARRNVNPFYYEKKKDIFDDVIIEYYKDRVDETCEIINIPSILHAIKLEHDIKVSLELDTVSAAQKEEKAAELYKESNVSRYILSVIDSCKNLASPGIKKKDNEELREVNAVARNDAIRDSEGMRVSDFIPEAVETPTISKYELHFFRSVYNIMPIQLSKFSAPTYDETMDEFSVRHEKEYEQPSAGDYFRIYQKYMDRVGPDSKTSAIITPHIDRRWNAISTMPELDMDYQKRLMGKIHKSLLYGFLYGRIFLDKTSDENPNKKVYKYLNADNDAVDLVVSNKTKCDVLYETLDSLYFDRLAVATIRNYVNELRIKNTTAGFRSYEDIEFFKLLNQLKFKKFVNKPELNTVNDRTSLFTIVLMYCNSLPVNNKDTAEMKTMVEAIIEMIYSEMYICIADKDNLHGKVADMLVDQYNCLMDNYKTYSKELKYNSIFSEQVLDSIYRIVCNFLSRIELESCIEKIHRLSDVN